MNAEWTIANGHPEHDLLAQTELLAIAVVLLQASPPTLKPKSP